MVAHFEEKCNKFTRFINFFRNGEKIYRRPGRGRLRFLIAFDHAVADAGLDRKSVV